jgi:hypothetical protein
VARKTNLPTIKRRFGSDLDVEALTGISRQTLRQDRLFGRLRFPWYRAGRRVLYDLTEVEAIIRRTAHGGAANTQLGELQK